MPFDAEPPQTSTDLLIFQRARDRIAAGWCQEIRHSHDGGVCIVGALGFALGLTRDHDEYSRTAHFAPTLGFRVGEPMDLWNDHPGRTQAEVLERFDSAISRLSAG